jgi:hypothetical protein
MTGTKSLRKLRGGHACCESAAGVMCSGERLTIHGARTTNEDTIVLYEPACHVNRLVIAHSDRIVNELSAHIKVVRNPIWGRT